MDIYFLPEMLGERLEAENDQMNLHYAMICYICAGSLNSFVSCWIKTQPDVGNSATCLQNLVEIVMVMQKALTAIGRLVNISEDGTVSHHLCQYASLLAAQGSLNTAASYLNSATEGEMLSLKERVYKALGYNAAPSNVRASVPASRTRTTSVASNSSQHFPRRTSTPQAFQVRNYT